MSRYHLVVASPEKVCRAMQSDAMIGVLGCNSDEGINVDVHDVFYFANSQGFVFAKALAAHVQRVDRPQNDVDLLRLNPDSEAKTNYIIGFTDPEFLYPHPLIEPFGGSWSVFAFDPVKSVRMVRVYRCGMIIDQIASGTASRLIKEGMLVRKRGKLFVHDRRSYKEYVAHRDRFTCRYCLRPVQVPEEKTYDHIISRMFRKDNRPSNLVLSCRECNHSKAHLSPKHFASLRLHKEDFRKIVITADAARDYASLLNQPIPISQAKRKLANLLANNISRIYARHDVVFLHCHNVKLAVVNHRVVKVLAA